MALNTALYSENVITGDDYNYLSYRLKQSIQRAEKIDIIIAFLMESGVKILIKDLQEAIDRGVSVNILTGDYLKITQPQALYLLKAKFKNKINLKFYNNPNRSFHPKSYIFHYNNDGEIYIGSSNISRGALTNSIEWNYRFKKSENEKDFNAFYETFEDLFNNHSFDVTDEVLEDYAKSWVAPKIFKEINKVKDNDEIKVINIYEPRGAQIEALYALSRTREEGFDKALVVASTGTGKTVTAVSDAKMMGERTLFIAHTKELVTQAKETFDNIWDNVDTGLYVAEKKEEDAYVVCGSIQSIAQNIEEFKPDDFGYIIIDECHHGTANTYRKILGHFKPKFTLGLTATPGQYVVASKKQRQLDKDMSFSYKLEEYYNRPIFKK